jgi:hypothetical protein
MRQRILASDHVEWEEDILPNLPEGWIFTPSFVLYPQSVMVDGELDEEKYLEWLRALPFGALVNLDFEEPWLTPVREGKGAEVGLFRAMLTFSRAERPDLLVAFYAVGNQPFVLDSLGGSGNQYWDRAHDQQKAAARFAWMRWRAVTALQGWYGPTCYDKYEGQQPSEPAWTRASVATCKLEGDGKLILPFTWSQRDHVQLTAEEWLAGQVNPALEAGAHGIILWEAWNKTQQVPNRRARVVEFVQALPPQVASEPPP